jgi:hypothetical protein
MRIVATPWMMNDSFLGGITSKEVAMRDEDKT